MKKLLLTLLEEVKELKTMIQINTFKIASSKPDETLLTSADVKNKLKISESTLLRLRKENKIRYVKFGRTNYYPLSFFNNMESHYRKERSNGNP